VVGKAECLSLKGNHSRGVISEAINSIGEAEISPLHIRVKVKTDDQIRVCPPGSGSHFSIKILEFISFIELNSVLTKFFSVYKPAERVAA
jgi:hypothetical protein